MIKIRILMMAICLLLVGINPARAQQMSTAHEARDTSSSRSGSISGRVMSEDGQPLANMPVSVWSRSNTARGNTTSTDGDGKFRVSNLDPGAYSVMAYHPAYVPESGLVTDLSQRPFYRVGDSVTIRMIKGGVITGTVTNGNGEPVVAARVRALRVRDREGRSLPTVFRGRERQTDDRGVYRLYGLEPGTYIISVGGSPPNPMPTAYDGDTPTYYPSNTRDTATEVAVQSGQEMTGIDIRYRGEPGHTISGTVSGATEATPGYVITSILVSLWHPASQTIESETSVFPRDNNNGFSFNGVPDGDYDVMAQRTLGANRITLTSTPRRVTVKGSDVTGVQLTLVSLGSISGRFLIKPTRETERQADCASQRSPLPEEVVITSRRDEQGQVKEQLYPRFFSTAESSPDKKGDFILRNIAEGRYRLYVRLLNEDWYLRAMTLPGAASTTAPGGAPARQASDVARNGLGLKSGERLTGLTVTVSAGAASLRGRVVPATEGAALPGQLRMHMVPAEREHTDDVLRFYETSVRSDGTFSLTNVAPGRYWLIARPVPKNEPAEITNRPAAWDANRRADLRREAESANTAINLQSCQRITDHILRYISPPINVPTTKPAKY